ncbi:MAG: 3-deoxy-7-phosphoheptulonate synthase [Bacteroidetes bacterium]|nr:MAG: 3-deoxy-7-phosphoheptulonate synthase [Bacteroidota bacterium]
MQPYTLIAGPCSAESFQQLSNTIQKIVAEGIKLQYFRAGIWKPRTRPGTFEGIGEKALEWMSSLQKEYHIRFITEVASPEHVEKCLQYGINTFWIGARTAVSPFAVQEISESLTDEVNMIYLKNPVSPDLSLWIGGLERLMQAVGERKVGAVHRGFSLGDNKGYRNAPKWEIPIELKSCFPDVPLLVDPSHICGNTNNIPKIAQKAIDLGFDGLMLEVHINPREALSDKEQQLTPEELHNLIRKIEKKSSRKLSDIELYRNMIDEIDEELIRLIKKRLDIVEKIGEVKMQHNLSAFQIERWKEIISTRTSLAEHLALENHVVREFLQFIHKHSIHVQSKVFDNKLKNSE